ncbi:MAG TPA: pyruvate oxidoreductase subunit gamma [Firmicutes bacterium]|nr:pyruvate oxidoreductase subunit gamma [Bacillota bacterium]
MAALTKIALAGEGGQGVQAVGEILAEAAFLAGMEAAYIPNFGVEQRGGVSIAFVQMGTERIGAPKFKKADILVALSQRAVERTKRYLTPNTLFIYDSSALQPPEIDDQAIGVHNWDTVAPEAFADQVSNRPGKPLQPPPVGKAVGIPAARVAKEELSPRVFNIIILGAIIAASRILPPEIVKKSMEEKFREKFAAKPQLAELNYRAFARGQELFQKIAVAEGAESQWNRRP